MSSKVKENEKNKAKLAKVKEQKVLEQSFLDILGIENIVSRDPKELTNISYILDQLKGRNIEGVFEVKKSSEDEIFFDWMFDQKNKETRFLIHGTRCTSVLPIIEQGLKIRPAGNFQFSGKVYGDGNYFSEVTSKSLNYTGYDQDQILLIYQVHTGKPFVYEGWYKGNNFTLCYNELQKRGFDSTHVNAGNGLLNSEIIAYKEQQARIRYVIWLNKR